MANFFAAQVANALESSWRPLRDQISCRLQVIGGRSGSFWRAAGLARPARWQSGFAPRWHPAKPAGLPPSRPPLRMRAMFW